MDNPETLNYNDDWKPVYNPTQYNSYEELTDENPKPEKPKKSRAKPLLTLIQIIICIIAVLSFYSLKTFDKNLYNKLYELYITNLNNEIILTDSFEDFSLDNIINAFKNK